MTETTCPKCGERLLVKIVTHVQEWGEPDVFPYFDYETGEQFYAVREYCQNGWLRSHFQKITSMLTYEQAKKKATL